MKRCGIGIITLILCATVLFPAHPLLAAPPIPSSPLFISEIATGGCSVSVATTACPSASSNHLGEQEFIELYNTQAAPFIVHGWTVQYTTSSGSTATTLATLDGTIAANDYLLVAHAGAYADADLTFGTVGDGGKLAASAGYVTLVDDHGTVVDAVGWGSGLNASGLAGWPTTATIPYGESVSRILPGSPLYGSGQVFAAPAWQLSPQGGGYTPALPVDTIAPAQAAQPPSSTTPLIVTAFRLNAGTPVFVQLYNNADTAFDLRGWSLAYTAHDAASELTLTLATFTDWLIPHGYTVVADGTITNADVSFSLNTVTRQQLTNLPTAGITLASPSGTVTSLDLSTTPSLTYGQWLQRLQSSSGKYTITGAGSDFTAQSGAATLHAGGLYEPPDTTGGLEVVELLPHAPDCSPLGTSQLCADYIKLFNASSTAIDLTKFRLRTDSGGLQSTSSNTIPLSGSLAPGAYLLLNSRNKGSPLSLTDSGGYVWLEDTYGVRIYNPVVQYPSASSASKIAWTWALDDGVWRWSSQPSPDGPNSFPPGSTADDSDTPSVLKPCRPDQYRNPATNRCRSLVVAGTTLQPCAAGQERNPQTNRCRAVLAASTSLQPCAMGQTRNPATNRCRKDTESTIPNVSDVAAATTDHSSLTPWIITALVVAAALAYAVYEWRQDILLQYQRLRAASVCVISSRFKRNRRH